MRITVLSVLQTHPHRLALKNPTITKKMINAGTVEEHLYSQKRVAGVAPYRGIILHPC